MRKDLMLVAALTGLTFSRLSADPGGIPASQAGSSQNPSINTRTEEPGEVSDRSTTRASISDEVTSSSNRGIGAAQDLRGETPGTLGARGTIGQDGTGFTGQERIGTLPPGRLGFQKTNDYDKGFDRANDLLKQSERTGEPAPFDPSAAGGPASSQVGRASQLDPGSSTSRTNSISNESLGKTSGAAVTPADSGPTGLAGEAGRYNGVARDSQPVTPGSQTSAIIGAEKQAASATQTNAPVSAQGAAPGSASENSNSGISGSGKASPNPDVHLRHVDNSQEDRQMSRRIHDQLLSSSGASKTMRLTPKQLRQVQVKAANGEVTLSGAVETADQKREIESVVKEMPGVSSVKNDLAIKGADAKTDNLPSGPR